MIAVVAAAGIAAGDVIVVDAIAVAVRAVIEDACRSGQGRNQCITYLRFLVQNSIRVPSGSCT